jgi:hypothetical protein
MKTIKIEKTKITEVKVKFRGNENKEMDYKDLIELSLDIVPSGGFTPKDIKDRNRIQEALDKSDGKIIVLEDADFENLEKIVKDSRWTIRDKELNIFLKKFEDGDYKKESIKK